MCKYSSLCLKKARILFLSYNQNIIITSKRDDNGCLIVKKYLVNYQ